MSTAQARATAEVSIDAVRAQFPILQRKVYGIPLAYLDNGATSQKPLAVIEALDHYNREFNSNVHRGVHRLSQEATDAYEKARESVQRLINASDAKEVIFCRGTTEAINLIAQSYGRANIEEGDEIILSAMEHHSNIVPWQMLCEEKKAVIKVAPMDRDGNILLDEYKKLLNPRTKIVALIHVSNVLGTVLPIKEMTALAHEQGAVVVIDGAQGIPHMSVDVQDLNCDFYAFSAHKMFGPTGIGALFGKKHILDAMPPWQGGGSMIKTVTFEKSTYADVPERFEAGTPSIAEAVGFGAAAEWMMEIGLDFIAAQEHELVEYATAELNKIDGVTLLGNAPGKASVISFTIDGVHPHDIGTILDREGVAVRAGHHCAQPIMDFYGVAATVRASFAVYNTKAEVDALVAATRKVKEMFA